MNSAQQARDKANGRRAIAGLSHFSLEKSVADSRFSLKSDERPPARASDISTFARRSYFVLPRQP